MMLKGKVPTLHNRRLYLIESMKSEVTGEKSSRAENSSIWVRVVSTYFSQQLALEGEYQVLSLTAWSFTTLYPSTYIIHSFIFGV